MAFGDRQAWCRNAALLVQNEDTDEGLDPANLTTIAESTLAWLGRHLPRVTSTTFNGDGTNFQFTLPSDWIAGFSEIVDVEYPAGSQIRSIVHRGQYELYPHPRSATKLHFSQVTPASGSANILAIYTTLHTCSDSTTTVPSTEQTGYEFALAHVLCAVSATRYGRSTSPTVQADVVDYQSKALVWRENAAMWLAMASRALGVALEEYKAGTGPDGATASPAVTVPRGLGLEPHTGRGRK